MMKKILFLTDLSNGEKEDLITIEFLRKYYHVDISYIDLGFEKLYNYDLILLRNTWPNNESKLKYYNTRKIELFAFIEKNNLKIYNELKSDFDRKGKKYLVDLFNKGYDVIPSYSEILNIPEKINEFILKPIDGFSSYGLKKLKKDKLQDINLNNYILQEKVDFEYELSFYFINDKFLYSLIFKPSKIPEWPDPIVYTPTKKEINIAKEFVKLNKMKNGLSRIDFLRLKNKELKLLEIEDDSPYFSITEIPNNLQKLYLKEFSKAIDNFI